jgi:hypothetical protein
MLTSQANDLISKGTEPTESRLTKANKSEARSWRAETKVQVSPAIFIVNAATNTWFWSSALKNYKKIPMV